MRTRVMVVGLLVLVGLAGCGGRATQSPAESAAESTVEVAEALGPEAGALAAMGFDLGSAGIAPSAQASPSTVDKVRPGRHKLRVFLRRNILHGEVVVQTKDGPKTIVVQRGTVTAIDAKSITVKSTDGFVLTWTFGDPLHVLEHRTTIQPSQVAVGAVVGVAGAKDGDQTTARLVVIK